VRLACSGLLAERAGSVAGAAYLLIRELLSRGIDVDFYAEKGYIPMPESLAGPRFNYVGIGRPRWMSSMSSRALFTTIWLLAPVVQRSWENLFGPIATERHRATPYDAVLSLGAAPRFTIPGVPTITWLQGAPRTEGAAIRRLRAQIIADSGFADYYALRAYYFPRRFYDRRLLSSSDALICGSSWTECMLVQLGIPADKIIVLPYPIDLGRFVPPDEELVDWSQPEIVWLGRIVPRKRLDLLVDAMPSVAMRFPGVRLRVVGAPGFGAGTLKLLKESLVRDRITYERTIDRESVPALLQRAAAVVQTSESEDFGSVIAEAQACGVSVVVGPTNGTLDYIDEMSTVFERYTPESVAEAIVSTFETRRRAPDASRRSARQSAERWFAPPTIADQVLAVIAGMHEVSRA
jgi:glycosyltransferase involved in cell wall biosynthesis